MKSRIYQALAFLFQVQRPVNVCLLATLFVINVGLMYNENQLSSLRYRCLLFFLFQLRLVLPFIISHSCQKFILSLHEVRFPLTTIRAAEVRRPVSDVPLKRSAKQRKCLPIGDKIHLGIFGTLNVFIAFIVDNLGRKK